MLEVNGRIIFDDDDVKRAEHPAIRALGSVSLGDVIFPHGFYLKEVDGKTRVFPMTKEEWDAEIAAININGVILHPKYSCRNYDAYTCTGDCIGAIGAPFCTRAYNPPDMKYYCGCRRS